MSTAYVKWLSTYYLLKWKLTCIFSNAVRFWCCDQSEFIQHFTLSHQKNRTIFWPKYYQKIKKKLSMISTLIKIADWGMYSFIFNHFNWLIQFFLKIWPRNHHKKFFEQKFRKKFTVMSSFKLEMIDGRDARDPIWALLNVFALDKMRFRPQGGFDCRTLTQEGFDWKIFGFSGLKRPKWCRDF